MHRSSLLVAVVVLSISIALCSATAQAANGGANLGLSSSLLYVSSFLFLSAPNTLSSLYTHANVLLVTIPRLRMNSREKHTLKSESAKDLSGVYTVQRQANVAHNVAGGSKYVVPSVLFFGTRKEGVKVAFLCLFQKWHTQPSKLFFFFCAPLLRPRRPSLLLLRFPAFQLAFGPPLLVSSHLHTHS